MCPVTANPGHAEKPCDPPVGAAEIQDVCHPGVAAGVAGATATGAAGEEGMVMVRARIVARQESRTIVVPVVAPEGIDPTGAVPRSYEVVASGPLPDFRVLDGLGLEPPVEAHVSKGEGEGEGGGVAEIRFSWAERVPQDLRARLALDRTLERVALPLPPPPPPAVEVPASP